MKKIVSIILIVFIGTMLFQFLNPSVIRSEELTLEDTIIADNNMKLSLYKKFDEFITDNPDLEYELRDVSWSIYTQKSSEKNILYYFEDGFWISTSNYCSDFNEIPDEKQCIIRVTIDSNLRFETSKGIRLGDSYSKVIEQYGDLDYEIDFNNTNSYHSAKYTYEDSGKEIEIGFEFNNDREIIKITLNSLDVYSAN